jgi:hypothetical protein
MFGINEASLLAGLLAIFCFSNSIHGEFVFDDREAIVKNKDMLIQSPWADILQHDFWGAELTSSTSHKSYRPLTTASFKLNCHASGLEPLGFHLVNIALHAIVSGLLVQFSFKVFRGASECGDAAMDIASALVVGLIFAAHPVHCEAVAGIVGRVGCSYMFVSFLGAAKLETDP